MFVLVGSLYCIFLMDSICAHLQPFLYNIIHIDPWPLLILFNFSIILFI